MATNFDLLGDPIPEGWGKRGRPPHTPDDKKRLKVKLLRAIGRTNDEIAAALGITEKTLRKHYFRELGSRDEAKFQVEGTRLLKLYEGVEEGKIAAIKELGKILDKAELADNAFAKRAAAIGKPKKEPKLGKKDQAVKDAQTPDLETPLGRAMAQRLQQQDLKLN
jgi:predicted transcriptional regulator